MIPKIIGFFINAIGVCFPKISARMAIKLFSTPREGKPTKLEDNYLNTASKKRLSYENVSIMTYLWEGKKDTILLAHGWESNSFRWKDLIEHLKPFNYNIIALDAPAHGNSSGKLFNALLYSECINVVAKSFKVDTIIGHSVGGMATVFFQHKYKIPTIKKLVLLGAPSNFYGVLYRYKQMMSYSNRVSKHIDKLVLKRFNHKPNHFDAAKFSENIKTKGLIIHDKKDMIIPFKDALNFNEKYINSKLITTSGYNHSLRSLEVNQHILDFIND
ncbi:alpha/beta fold hydrolase [Ichthyenterobacterium magnum]|uniref:Alpha/beta hydrolase family protein n=1 Tax=Ichthyenterobacterium magnum TaxID=1230530 RepID=A0A420DEV6_9FLAO|nr:alpha/beta hydrolase [Ichthyenterobacterium magnum]RKE90891.1 alpha/beta hydrolase family protein [Ichthyenterobacterium magnum]